MPKSPILSRECYFEVLRDGTLRDLDWSLVQTTLGAMLEPVSLIRETGAVTQGDPYDSSYTRLVPADPRVMGAWATGGAQWPQSYNTL